MGRSTSARSSGPIYRPTCYVRTLRMPEARRCCYVCGADEYGVGDHDRTPKNDDIPYDRIRRLAGATTIEVRPSTASGSSLRRVVRERACPPTTRSSAQDFFRLPRRGRLSPAESTNEQLYCTEGRDASSPIATSRRHVLRTAVEAGARGDECPSCGTVARGRYDLVEPICWGLLRHARLFSGSSTRHWYLDSAQTPRRAHRRMVQRSPRVEGQREASSSAAMLEGPARPRPITRDIWNGVSRCPSDRGRAGELEQGPLRLVRRPHRLHLVHPGVGRGPIGDPEAWKTLLATGPGRGRGWCTSSARTTSRSTA